MGINDLVSRVKVCNTQDEYLDVLKLLADNVNKYLKDETLGLSALEEKIVFIIKQRVIYNFNSEKMQLYYKYVDKIKRGISKFYNIGKDEVEIKNLDDLIASLKIYKLKNATLSSFIYKSSNDLASDLSEIIENKSGSLLEKNYVKMVIKKLDSSECIDDIDIREDENFYRIIQTIKLDSYYNSKEKTSKLAMSNKYRKKLECEEDTNEIESLFDEVRKK